MFFFTILPLTFLASFRPAMMPASLNALIPWLPTAMAIELIGPLILGQQISDLSLMAAAGLILYRIPFATIGSRKFQSSENLAV